MTNSEAKATNKQFASNLVCSTVGGYGMKVICSKCFNPSIHRHHHFSAKPCQSENHKEVSNG